MKKVLYEFYKNTIAFLIVYFIALFCCFGEQSDGDVDMAVSGGNSTVFGEFYSNDSHPEESAVSFDFSDCSIRDIIFAVSIDSGISIVADDTVDGTGNFKFFGGNLEAAFDAFLLGNRLYVHKGKNLWTVSKFRFSVVDENKITDGDEKYFVDAYDLYPYEIVEKLAENVNWALTFDSLPNQKISVHLKGLEKHDLVNSLCQVFGNYISVESDSGIHIKKNQDMFNNAGGYNNSFSSDAGHINITSNDDFSVSVDIESGSFFQAIEGLFDEINRKSSDNVTGFCILGNADSIIKRSVFIGKDFYDTLEKLCGQNGYQYVKDENIFYILVDNDARGRLLSGEKSWSQFSLCYTSTDEFLPVLFKKIGNIETISLFDKASFLCNCSDNEKKLIEEFINDVDVKRSVYLVSLKYLKPEEFLEHLPPNIDRDSLFIADDSSRLYFRGTEESYKNLCEQILVCDKPVTRLSYDLLILQYDETEQNSWSSSFGTKKLKMGDRSNLSATLGSVMGFNLNVVSAFGVAFAADLQASIEANRTDVYADTTLHGVSGKQISFQNTNTYRYRDNNVNPENGKPVYSGVTKEIITGIKIDVLGWVSGDGIITSTVTASISRQGIDTSSSTGNPPPTSEKLVTTEVTGKSGEPIVLSGLLLSAENKSEKRAPWISKIPLIGNLFKNKNDNKEKSQMIIYLVPHIENEEFQFLHEDSLYGEKWFQEQMNILINNIGLTVFNEKNIINHNATDVIQEKSL